MIKLMRVDDRLIHGQVAATWTNTIEADCILIAKRSCGLYAYESVPAVFGFIAACKGHALDTIYMAVNGGDDTDTVACMAGYIVGAFHGADAYPESHLNLINSANGYDLEKMAADIDAMI